MIEKIEKAEKEPLKLSLETLSLQELEALLAYKRKEKIYISGSKKILFFLFLLFLILTISEGVFELSGLEEEQKTSTRRSLSC
jgi:hypothetical protein